MQQLTAVVLLALGLPCATLAQEAESRRDTMPWNAGVYVGGLSLDVDELDAIGMSGDTGVIFGARVGYRFADHWEVEVGYGYSPLEGTSEVDTAGQIDGDLHVYHTTVGYLAPEEGRARFRLSMGLGGMRYSYEPFTRRNEAGEEVNLVDTSWAHELVILLGIGAEFDVQERIAFRADLRDHVQFCRAENTPINETSDFSHCPLDDKVLHNPEFTGGIAFRF